jgi:uncharacterized membrane protein YbhN (UPF0104 family)
MRLGGGATILAVLAWRVGTGPFVAGLRAVDGVAVLAALGLGALTTLASAWRWRLVARGLDLPLRLPAAVADYYRALFLNAALPGGVLGDVHRAVRHGRGNGDVGRGVEAVVLERAAGQVTLLAATVIVLLVPGSPAGALLARTPPASALAASGLLLAAVAVALGVLVVRAERRWAARVRAVIGHARRALLGRDVRGGIALSSAIVLAGHVSLFLVAARTAGASAPVGRLVPVLLLALLAMALPLNIGGWGPREGVLAWAFAALGLSAQQGLAVGVSYGVLALVASLPGAVVLVTDLRIARRARTAAAPRRPVAGPRPAPRDAGRSTGSPRPRRIGALPIRPRRTALSPVAAHPPGPR